MAHGTEPHDHPYEKKPICECGHATNVHQAYNKEGKKYNPHKNQYGNFVSDIQKWVKENAEELPEHHEITDALSIDQLSHFGECKLGSCKKKCKEFKEKAIPEILPETNPEIVEPVEPLVFDEENLQFGKDGRTETLPPPIVSEEFQNFHENISDTDTLNVGPSDKKEE